MRPPVLRWLLWLAFFGLPCCLLGADGTDGKNGTGGIPHFNQLQVVLPILVPSLIALLKLIFPRVPKVLLPFLCPFLGWALDQVAKLAGLEGAGAEWAAAMGAMGIALREMFDQSKKALGLGWSTALLLLSATLAIGTVGCTSGKPAKVMRPTSTAYKRPFKAPPMPPGMEFTLAPASQAQTTAARMEPASVGSPPMQIIIEPPSESWPEGVSVAAVFVPVGYAGMIDFEPEVTGPREPAAAYGCYPEDTWVAVGYPLAYPRDQRGFFVGYNLPCSAVERSFSIPEGVDTGRTIQIKGSTWKLMELPSGPPDPKRRAYRLYRLVKSR